MRPPSTATSAATAGSPVPSTTVPPRTIRSCIGFSYLLAVWAILPQDENVFQFSAAPGRSRHDDHDPGGREPRRPRQLRRLRPPRDVRPPAARGAGVV